MSQHPFLRGGRCRAAATAAVAGRFSAAPPERARQGSGEAAIIPTQQLNIGAFELLLESLLWKVPLEDGAMVTRFRPLTHLAGH